MRVFFNQVSCGKDELVSLLRRFPFREALEWPCACLSTRCSRVAAPFRANIMTCSCAKIILFCLSIRPHTCRHRERQYKPEARRVHKRARACVCGCNNDISHTGTRCISYQHRRHTPAADTKRGHKPLPYSYSLLLFFTTHAEIIGCILRAASLPCSTAFLQHRGVMQTGRWLGCGPSQWPVNNLDALRQTVFAIWNQ